jgi:hypothetical protein
MQKVHKFLGSLSKLAPVKMQDPIKKITKPRCQRLTLVIPATQEAGIRRIVVRSQPGQIVQETLSQKYPSQKGLAGGSSPDK